MFLANLLSPSIDCFKQSMPRVTREIPWAGSGRLNTNHGPESLPFLSLSNGYRLVLKFAPVNQRKLDTVLMVSARITVLKPNDNTPCSRTSRRICCEVTFTSET